MLAAQLILITAGAILAIMAVILILRPSSNWEDDTTTSKSGLSHFNDKNVYNGRY